MSVLSWEQVYALARSVGCTDAQAIIAAAITQPESGRDPRNIGDQALAHFGSRGLWQLFTGAHDPADLGVGSGSWTQALADKLFDPETNAHGMWFISGHGKHWSPWSTYNEGAYKPYLDAATTAAQTVGDNWHAYLPDTPPPGATVSLVNVIAAANEDPNAAPDTPSHPHDVAPVITALIAGGLLDQRFAGTGAFTADVVGAYGAYQRSLGYSGADADGIPGETSLAALGQAHRFQVV